MLMSFTGTGISHAILATYIYLSSATNINLEGFQWVPVVSFSSMIFIASCGALPIPYVIVSEILPDKVSSIHEDFNIFQLWILFHANISSKNNFTLDSKRWLDNHFLHFVGSYLCSGSSVPNTTGHDRTARLHLRVFTLLLCHRCLFDNVRARDEGQKLRRDSNYSEGQINNQLDHQKPNFFYDDSNTTSAWTGFKRWTNTVYPWSGSGIQKENILQINSNIIYKFLKRMQNESIS